MTPTCGKTLKKKKKKQRGTPTQPSAQSKPKAFNNPFAGLSLENKESVQNNTAPEPPPVQPEPEPQPEAHPDRAHEGDIDPLEASIFLNAMGHVDRIEQDHRHAPEANARRVAAREDALALVELKALLEPEESWQIDEDEPFVSGRSSGVNDKLMAQLRRGEYPHERKLDLHGCTKNEAYQELKRFIIGCRRDGMRAVIVVTGRGHNSPDGQSVLKQALPGWITKTPISSHALAFSTAPKHLGGTGAFLILLKRKA